MYKKSFLVGIKYFSVMMGICRYGLNDGDDAVDAIV